MTKKYAGVACACAVFLLTAATTRAQARSGASDAPPAVVSATAVASATTVAPVSPAGPPVPCAMGAPKAAAADETGTHASSEPLAASTRVLLNVAWTLICAFLVMFMQGGFALLETGFCRAKNASHTMAMNIMVYCIGILAYWICGFALQMGGAGSQPGLGGGGALDGEVALQVAGKALGIFGAHGFFLSGGTADPAIFTIFLFQMVFMNVAVTIPTGAMAERFRFSAFVPYAFLMAGLIYPLFANWVWGGGWLSRLGADFGLGHGLVDFAGSSVVHMTGGVVALAGTLVLGPRIGKFNKDGSPNPIPGHHIPMAIVGTLLLAFGWFGLSTGSALPTGDLRVGAVAVNTMLAGAAGGFLAMTAMWMKYGKPDLTMSANGLLAGLVAISAPCAFVSPGWAVVIGAMAGLLCCLSVFFMERVLKVDDPVGAVSVHGVCGMWGVLSLGLCADGSYGKGVNGVPGTVRGLFYGDGGQLAAQLAGVAADLLFAFGAAWLLFKLLDRAMGIRVPSDIEREGLDQYEVAAAAYPEFSLRQLPFSSGYSGRSR